MGALYLGHHDILIYEMKIGEVKMLFAEEKEDKKEKEEKEETEEKEDEVENCCAQDRKGRTVGRE